MTYVIRQTNDGYWWQRLAPQGGWADYKGCGDRGLPFETEVAARTSINRDKIARSTAIYNEEVQVDE